MVVAAWHSLGEEVSAWAAAGRMVEFWWRDDDACVPDPALLRLFDVARGSRAPLALAAIPALAERAAFAGMPTTVALIQHGVDHRNREAYGGKKTEFESTEPVEAALARLAAGRARLQEVSGFHVLPVLAPPWNRIGPALAARLPEAGYAGLSTYGVRKVTNPAPGLRQANTHVDIIDWKGGRGFVGESAALGQAVRHLAARRSGVADAAEPTGWLTHHAVHDAAAWAFLEKLFDLTAGMKGVRWLHPAEVFAVPPGFGQLEQSR